MSGAGYRMVIPHFSGMQVVLSLICSTAKRRNKRRRMKRRKIKRMRIKRRRKRKR